MVPILLILSYAHDNALIKSAWGDRPILMAPRFGFDNGSNSDFDATLVLATMLVSQLNEVNTTDRPSVAQEPQSQHAKAGNASTVEHPSDHTKIWSDLSGNWHACGVNNISAQ